MRKLFWKTIPEHQVKGRPNLWTRGPAEQHQIDVQTIEELFGHDDCQSQSKVPPTRGGRGRTSFREVKEEVCILDAKRGMNIGIFLKQFKRSNESIVEDIRSGNSEVYGPEPLRELLKLLPESDEVKKLKLFRGDVSKLSLADSFVYLLIQLPSYVVHIESMLLKEEFPAECESMKHDIRTLRSAIKELMCCEELHAVLHLVLQAGNILNAGGYSGNAVGFKLSSLPSLAETKANKPGMNLLHFVALEAQKKDEKLLEFPLKLGHVQAASRISLETLDSDLQRLVSRTRSIEESIQRETELLQQLDAFLQSATAALCSLRGCRQQLKTESEELLDFFCEDKETFKLDDCFSIFNSFCLKFTAAVKDNTERERKEAARRRRLQELEEQKRHSWAAGEQFGSAFGLRSSSELDMHSALSRSDEAGLLMELLMPKSHPRSPLLRRSGSFRRTRNSTESDIKASGSKDAEKTDSSVSLPVANEQKPSNMTTNYLRKNERQAKIENPTSDLNNNGKETCNYQTSVKDELKQTEKTSCNSGNMSVKVEKCTLVPELKAFEKVSTPTKSKTQNDVVVTEFDEEKPDAKVQSLVKTDEEIGDTVIVWCVTGVCEVADGQNDQNLNFMDNNSTNPKPSKQQLAIPNVSPVRSQPQASTRLTDIAKEAENVDIKVEGRAVLTNENRGEWTNQEREIESSVLDIDSNGSQEVGVSTGNENVEIQSDEEQESQSQEQKLEENIMEEVQRKLLNDKTLKSQKSELNNGVSKEQNGEKVVKKRLDSKTSQSSKTLATPKTETLSKKAPSAKASSGCKSVRTLTSTESHNMRRVVPISRPNSAKVSDKPLGNQRGMSSLSVPGRNSSHRLERPSTAPSSRRSSFNKADNQEQDSRKRTATKKTQENKKLLQEEKICKSTLRSINRKEEREVSSAPVTPLHKNTPGFARNTASSSFRRTNTSLEKSSLSKNVPSSQNSASLSPKASPKTSPKISLNETSTNKQNSQAASMQNDGTPPKILSPKLSPSSNLRSAKTSMSPTLSGSNNKALSSKVSPQNANANSPHNYQKMSALSFQKPTIHISSVVSSKSSSLAKDQEDSANLKDKKMLQSVPPDFTDDDSNLNLVNDSVTLSRPASPNTRERFTSDDESPRKISTYYTKLSQSYAKSSVSSQNDRTVSSHSNLQSPLKSQFSSNSNESTNESLNLTNNNVALPQKSSLTIFPSPTLQNSTNNNPDSTQDETESALSETQRLEKSTKNFTNSEKCSNPQPKIASPKATTSPFRLQPNNNSNLTQNLSSKSPILSRPGSFRVTSTKSPDSSVKRSPSIKRPPHITPPSVRRRNDSGSFSENSSKDSRPTWR